MEVALDVFGEDVGFEVDGVAGGAIANVGVAVGVGDDGDFGDASLERRLPAGYGKADPIHGDGAFGDDLGSEAGGDFDAKKPRRVFLRPFRGSVGRQAGNMADGIYMA